MIFHEAWYKETNMDKTLFDNEWVTVKEKPDGWVYVETPPAVAVLPFKVEDGFESVKFLVRYEEIPTMGEGLQPWMIFGGIGEHGSPEEAALAELWEEGGIRASEDLLIDLGEVWTRKDASQPCRLFAVDVSELDQVEPEGDGSEGEKDYRLEWMGWYKLVEHPVSVLHSIAIRLYGRLYR